jgi:hypothetical protein
MIVFSFLSVPSQGSLTVEDCVVHIDLNLAKVIHEKWKDSVMVGGPLWRRTSFCVLFCCLSFSKKYSMLHERVQLDFDLKACTFTVNRLLIVFLFSYLRYFQNGQIKYLVMQLDVIAYVFFFFF